MLNSGLAQQGGPEQGAAPGQQQLHRLGEHQLWLWIVHAGKSERMLSKLDSFNPSLTRYNRSDNAPVLPLRDEPDLLSWLESSGRLVADEETGNTDLATVEEEELSALMGEKEDYSQQDENQEENWED